MVEWMRLRASQSCRPERSNISKIILLAGVILAVLAAFGVDIVDEADDFQLAIGICFASFLAS